MNSHRACGSAQNIVISIYVYAVAGAQKRLLPGARRTRRAFGFSSALSTAPSPCRTSRPRSALDQPIVSQHLAALRARNVVTVRREGRRPTTRCAARSSPTCCASPASSSITISLSVSPRASRCCASSSARVKASVQPGDALAAQVRPCPARLRRRDVPPRSPRRRHRRPRRAAAGDGVRHRLWPDAAGRHLLRHRHRLPDLGARRIARSDRRTYRRVCRRRRRHRRQVRRPWPLHVHDDGGRHAHHPWPDGDGIVVRFIPRPVVIGFTNGIAVLIASTQIRDFLGLAHDGEPRRVPRTPGGYRRITSTRSIPRQWGLASLTLVLVVATNRFVKAMPGTVVGLVVGTAVAWLAGLAGRNRGSRFGAVPSGLPEFHLPAFQPSLMLTLLSPALTVAHARRDRVADVGRGRRPDERRSSQSRTSSSSRRAWPTSSRRWFGGLPATGAIARTATNIRSGARTPVAGHDPRADAARCCCSSAPASPGTSRWPSSPAILFIVAANMGEWHEIPLLLRQTKTDIAVWLDDLRSDGVRRPHRRGRGRDDSRGAPLHPARSRRRRRSIR